MAETNPYAKEFDSLKPSLPRGTALSLRKAGLKGFLKLGGIPHPRMEDWRYADLSPVRSRYLPRHAPDTKKGKSKKFESISGWPVLLISEGGISGQTVPDELEILTLDQLGEKGDSIEKALFTPAVRVNPFDQLNISLAGEGLYINVKKGEEITGVELVFLSEGLDNEARYIRNFVNIEEGAKAKLFVRTISRDKAGWINTVNRINLEKNAALEWGSDFSAPDDVFLSSLSAVKVGKDARFAAYSLGAGLRSLRHEIHVNLAARGAKADLLGGMLAAKDETIDTLTQLTHEAGEAESSQTFRGVAAAKGSTAFQGCVIVNEDAQKTEAHQNCNNLLLDRDGTCNVKPQLLIFADDVICAHGATVGEIDEKALFYMLQRGIPEHEAKRMLVQAFLGEVLSRIPNENIREHFKLLSHDWMKKNFSGDKLA